MSKTCVPAKENIHQKSKQISDMYVEDKPCKCKKHQPCMQLKMLNAEFGNNFCWFFS